MERTLLLGALALQSPLPPITQFGVKIDITRRLEVQIEMRRYRAEQQHPSPALVVVLTSDVRSSAFVGSAVRILTMLQRRCPSLFCIPTSR